MNMIALAIIVAGSEIAGAIRWGDSEKISTNRAVSGVIDLVLLCWLIVMLIRA